jgi:CO/xanthine dehydrogenase Mo-binding subunit
VYDSGDYEAVLNEALAHADLDHWRTEQERGRREGRYIGIGVVSCQHRSTYSATEFWFHNPAPHVGMSTSAESVRMSIGPTGGFTVTLFAPTWGNGPETVVSQIVAEEFGIDPGDVNIVYGSALEGLPSCGPGGSRMAVMLAGAVHGAAAKIRDKMLDIAAHLLEVDRDDLEFADGRVSVRGVPSSSLTVADIAMKAFWYKSDLPEGMESGLEGSFTYDHPHMTLPSADRSDLGSFYPIMSHAVHVPVVEVDIETGHVRFLKYVAVHDSGTVVNPRALQNQIRGGIAQGLGISLMEQVRYDADGHNLSASLDEYLLPMAEDVPRIEVHHVETPSPFTAYGIMGAGEGGRMVAPPAITRAVEDALAPFGIRIDELPMTPEKIVRWLRDAGAYD